MVARDGGTRARLSRAGPFPVTRESIGIFIRRRLSQTPMIFALARRARKQKIRPWDQRDSTCPVPPCKNISLSASGKSSLQIRPSRPSRGAYRDRHGRWARDAVDAAASGAQWDRRAGLHGPVSNRRRADDRCCSRTAKACGPGTRCWCQVGGGMSAQPGADMPRIRQRR